MLKYDTARGLDCGSFLMLGPHFRAEQQRLLTLKLTWWGPQVPLFKFRRESVKKVWNGKLVCGVYCRLLGFWRGNKSLDGFINPELASRNRKILLHYIFAEQQKLPFFIVRWHFSADRLACSSLCSIRSHDRPPVLRLFASSSAQPWLTSDVGHKGVWDHYRQRHRTNEN